jgi:pimeloyl-ACP methyl ester carboxylesterase
MPLAPLRTFVPTSHGAMYVRVFGEAAAPPIVLLHMGPISGNMFDGFAQLLARERRVIVPDRLGFGESERPPEPLGIPGFAQATIEALDGLGVGEVDLFGVHTGSCEAIELATSHADRVRRVALVSLLVFSEEEARAFQERYRPAPPPQADGSHLLAYWDRWMGWRPPGWDLEHVETCVLDAVRAGRKSRWGLNAVVAYPTAQRLADVRQPLLIIVPDDYMLANTRSGLRSAPAGTTVVDFALAQAGTTPAAMFSMTPEPVWDIARPFFAGDGGIVADQR